MDQWMLIISIIVILFTLRSTADSFQWDFGDGGNVKWSNHCDFNGGDVGNVLSSKEDCGRLCFERPECTRFAWNRRDEGTCWFKRGSTEAADAIYVPDESSCGYVFAQKTMNIGSRPPYKQTSQMHTLRVNDDLNPLDSCKNEECHETLGDKTRFNRK